jgi:transcriptional regulator with XRE-family HTH domain
MESKNILAERIRQRRIQKGYSQEYLAESASISIRTLQRIEGGQTQPQGHTLMALAQALDMAIEDLMDFTKKNDRSILHLINLSALAYVVLPLGNIILPLIIWIMYKDKVEGVNRFGKRQVFIQVGWTMLIGVGFVLWVFGPSIYQSLGLETDKFSFIAAPMTATFTMYTLNAIYIATVFFLILKDKQVPFLGLGR